MPSLADMSGRYEPKEIPSAAGAPRDLTGMYRAARDSLSNLQGDAEAGLAKRLLDMTRRPEHSAMRAAMQ